MIKSFSRALRNTVSITAIAASAVGLSTAAHAVIVRDDVGLVTSRDNANTLSPVVQMFLLDNLTGDVFFNCTGTMINPRTVITAAHCVKDLPSEAYDPNNPLGFSILIGSGPNTNSRIFGFISNGWNHAQGGAAISSDVIIHPAANQENEDLPFPWADVAMIALAEPITTGVGRMDILLSAMPGPFHVQVAGYGTTGTGNTGQGSISTRRIIGENQVQMLGSYDDMFQATDGLPRLGFNTQNLYFFDFDNPNRPSGLSSCTLGTGVLGFPSCPNQQAFSDLDWFGGNALAREVATAPGDSGGPLISDTLGRNLVTGVLSGGWNWDFFYPGLAPTNFGYGDQSYYNPLYLFHEFIVQNNPYKYVSAKPGGGAWESAATWQQDLDPGYFILQGGVPVNGIPTGGEPGVGGTTPKWGSVFGTNISGFSTTPLPGLPFASPGGGDPLAAAVRTFVATEQVIDPDTGLPVSANMAAALANISAPRALANVAPPPAPLIGPGSQNFVPNNTDGAPGTAFANPAQYFDVTLRNSGTITLSSVRDIDRLTINNASARLQINATGDLLTLIDSTVTSGNLTVNGLLFTPRLTVASGGTLQGSGTIIGTAININGRIAPGNSIGTINLVGPVVQTGTSYTEIELTNGLSDIINVTGNITLAGSVEFKPFGAPPLQGQFYDFVQATGTRSGTFATVIDNLPGLLFPVVTYGANTARVTINASTFCSVAPTEPMCSTLDGLNGTTTPAMQALIGNLQLIDPSDTAKALASVNPSRVNGQGNLGLTFGDLVKAQLGHRSSDLIGAVGGEQTAMMRAAGQLAAAGASSDTLMASAMIAAAQSSSGGMTVNRPGLVLFGAADWASAETDNAGGVDKSDADAFTAGLEYGTGEGLAAGMAISALDGTVDQSYGLGGQSAGDGYNVSAYAAYASGSVAVDAYVSKGWHDFDTTRRVMTGPATFVTATGSTSSDQLLAGATINVPVLKKPSFLAAAVGGIYYGSMDIDGYTETGAGGWSVIIGSRSIDSLKGQAGVEMSGKIKTGFGSVTPFARLQMTHEFENDGLVFTGAFSAAPASTFTVAAPVLGDTYGTAAVGVSALWGDNLSLYARYQTDVSRDGQTIDQVSLAARVGF